PFLMQRLDHEYLMRVSEAPLLKRLPSEYIREMFFTMQPMETTNLKLLEGTFDAIRADTQLLYASDWPHWDFDVPARLFDLPFLDDRAKRNILGYNAARVFNLPIPEQYRQVPDVAAERTCLVDRDGGRLDDLIVLARLVTQKRAELLGGPALALDAELGKARLQRRRPQRVVHGRIELLDDRRGCADGRKEPVGRFRRKA